MSGWTITKEGNVRLEHLSTSSTVILTVITPSEIVGDADAEHVIYMDYAEFYDLMKCMKHINEHLTG